jgi:methionyl aminopeptidase
MVYSEKEIEKIAVAGKKLSLVMQKLADKIRPGINTKELSEAAGLFIKEQGAKPAFLGYQGFPEVICTSVNSEIVHGIPRRDKILKEGDIVGIDVGLEYEGFYADMARTFPVGSVSPEAERLLKVTEEALRLGIAEAKTGNTLGDIGASIQKYVEEAGFSVVRDLVGHGVGRHIHEEPSVPNYGEEGQGPKLIEGTVLAIEPMVNAGDWRIKILEDGWTVVTADGSLSAHFEHTVLVTISGGEILTK